MKYKNIEFNAWCLPAILTWLGLTLMICNDIDKVSEPIMTTVQDAVMVSVIFFIIIGIGTLAGFFGIKIKKK